MPDKRDLDLVNEEILHEALTKEEKYLLKYFRTEEGKAFLKYYLKFGNYTRFIDNTGYYLPIRTMVHYKKKINDIRELHEKAKKNFDFEMISLLESGKYVYYNKK